MGARGGETTRSQHPREGLEGKVDRLPIVSEDDPLLAPSAVPSRLPVPSTASQEYPASLSWRRKSIFSEVGIEDINKAFGTESVQYLNQSGLGWIFQFGIFMAVVVLGGFHPLLYEAALHNPITGSKIPEFNPHSVYMVSFFGLFLISTIFAGLFHGSSHILMCLNPRSIFLSLPLSIIFAYGEALDMFILERIDSATKTTLGQIKLPFTALVSTIVLRKSIPSIEWCQILGATFSIVGYCAFKDRHLDSHIDPIAVAYLFLNVFLSTFGCIGTEVVLKNQKQRFFVRLAQMRIGAFLVSSCLFMFHVYWYSLYQPFFYGWNWKVVLLVGWTSLKDCLIQALIKRLDNVWRTLAGSLSLGLSYLASSFYYKNIDLILCLFVLVLVIHVVALSLARRAHSKLLDLVEEYPS